MYNPDDILQETWNRGWLYIFRHQQRKIINKLLQFLAMHFLCPPKMRSRLQKWRGVKMKDPLSNYFMDHVNFDERVPENISLGRRAYIAAGARLVTHRYLVHGYALKTNILLEDDVFIGLNAIVMGPAHLGKGCMVAAGSIVTGDVEPGAMVAGIPAKKIGVYDGEKILKDVKEALAKKKP